MLSLVGTGEDLNKSKWELFLNKPSLKTQKINLKKLFKQKMYD